MPVFLIFFKIMRNLDWIFIISAYNIFHMNTLIAIDDIACVRHGRNCCYKQLWIIWSSHVAEFYQLQNQKFKARRCNYYFKGFRLCRSEPLTHICAENNDGKGTSVPQGSRFQQIRVLVNLQWCISIYPTRIYPSNKSTLKNKSSCRWRLC